MTETKQLKERPKCNGFWVKTDKYNEEREMNSK